MPSKFDGYSSLLTESEHETVSWLIGPNAKTLCTTVAQMYTSRNCQTTKWTKDHAGVLCFVKDTKRLAFYLQMYCLEKKKKLWEQIIYPELNYIVIIPPSHIMETDIGKIAFNFRDDEEAEYLKDCVIEATQHVETPAKNEATPLVETTKDNKFFSSLPSLDSNAHKRPIKKKMSRKNSLKVEISSPSDFQHKIHVSYDKTDGLNIQGESTRLKEFLRGAGVTSSELKDGNLRDVVQKFFKEFGGIHSVLKKQAEFVSKTDGTAEDRVDGQDESDYDHPVPFSERVRLTTPNGSLYDAVKPPRLVKSSSVDSDDYDYITRPPHPVERTNQSSRNSKMSSKNMKSLTLKMPNANGQSEEDGRVKAPPLPRKLAKHHSCDDILNDIDTPTDKSNGYKPPIPKKHRSFSATSSQISQDAMKYHSSSDDLSNESGSAPAKGNYKPQVPPKKESLRLLTSQKKPAIVRKNSCDEMSKFIDEMVEDLKTINFPPTNQEGDLTELLKLKIEIRKSQMYLDDRASELL